MIRHFLLIAWRNIKRRKALSFIQILCLTIGLASFILVARYVQYEKNWDKFNAKYERIYRVQRYRIDDRTSVNEHLVAPLPKYLRNNIPEVENAILLREIYGEYLSSDVENTFYEPLGFLAPSDVFSMFSFELIEGDKKTVLDKPNSIVLSQKLAEKYFPGQSAMGKILLDEKKQELEITGIMKNIPEQSTIEATYFRSNTDLLKKRENDWGNNSYTTFALLKPNTSYLQVSEKIKYVLNEHDENAKVIAYLHPLSMLHLKGNPGDDSAVVIYFFSFIGILTLLLACVSFMNLTTSFSSLRSIEIGVRKVSGSSKRSISMQFLTEAIVLSFISLFLAVLLSYLLMPFFNQVVDRNISLQLHKNPYFILVLVASIIATGFLSGSYPALVIAQFKPVTVLKGKNPFIKGKITGLRGMVYFQFILSVILITSSLWMFKQVSYLNNKDLGFNKENLLHCNLPVMEDGASYKLLRELTLSNPGIEDMSLSINSPLRSEWGTHVLYEGGSVSDKTFARYNIACPNWLKTMGIQIVNGRNFYKEFSANQNKCIINETAVKKFGWDNPIGKWIDRGEKRYVVIGVVKDFNIEDVHNPIRPFILLANNQEFGNNNDLTFKINPTNHQSSIAHINSVLSELYPNILFKVTDYLAEVNRDDMKIWTSAKKTFSFFTVLAVIIATLGLFGLVVFASQRKIKEIGIRKVQGAKAIEILPLVTKQFIFLIIIANLNVIPLAYLLEKITPGAFKYHFTIIDLLTVLGISLLVTAVASGYQSIKASKLNPVVALRYE